MHIESANGIKQWKYKDFSYFIETPNFFHLYIDERSFFLIPKDAFTGTDALHDARVLLKEKIGMK